MRPAAWIPVERVTSLPAAHAWDDENPYRVIARRDEALARRCAAISLRARIALAIACAEWVLARLGPSLNEEWPWRFLEASWAALVDPRFALLREDLLDDDAGPVRGPAALALACVADAFRSEDAGDPAFAAALAAHVLGADSGFARWLEVSVARLERRHPSGTDRAIARESFGADLSPDEESRLVRRFLRRLDAARNEFLVPSRH